MSAEYVRPGTRRAAVAAFGVGAAVDVVYVLLVLGQGTELGPREVFFAAFLGVMAAFALAGAAMGTLDERFGQVLLYGATTGYLLAGLLGLASIGLFLIVAGLLAFIGRRTAPRAGRCRCRCRGHFGGRPDHRDGTDVGR